MAVKTKVQGSQPMPASADDKQKALDTALDQIEKRFGKGAVMKLGQAAAMNVDAIPTGSIRLDLALGIGGGRREGSSRCSAPSPPVRRPLPSR